MGEEPSGCLSTASQSPSLKEGQTSTFSTRRTTTPKMSDSQTLMGTSILEPSLLT